MIDLKKTRSPRPMRPYKCRFVRPICRQWQKRRSPAWPPAAGGPERAIAMGPPRRDVCRADSDKKTLAFELFIL